MSDDNRSSDDETSGPRINFQNVKRPQFGGLPSSKPAFGGFKDIKPVVKKPSISGFSGFGKNSAEPSVVSKKPPSLGLGNIRETVPAKPVVSVAKSSSSDLSRELILVIEKLVDKTDKIVERQNDGIESLCSAFSESLKVSQGASEKHYASMFQILQQVAQQNHEALLAVIQASAGTPVAQFEKFGELVDIKFNGTKVVFDSTLTEKKVEELEDGIVRHYPNMTVFLSEE